MDANDARFILRGESGYPERLLELTDSPPKVWIRGGLDFEGPRVAIVGSRRASVRGRQLARSLAAGLARAGVVVVSGGALGIDAAAHQGALDGGGMTWVVLPTPIVAPSPQTNRRLFDKVLSGGGAWLSEQAEFGRFGFSKRNRLIAALADGVVVVEAGARSGTRHTVTAARRLGRWVAAYPWGVGDVQGAGCLTLLREGAEMVTDATDVLARIGCSVNSVPPTMDDPILSALGTSAMTVEGLASILERSVPEVLVGLTQLEVEGRIRAVSGGRFVRSP